MSLTRFWRKQHPRCCKSSAAKRATCESVELQFQVHLQLFVQTDECIDQQLFNHCVARCLMPSTSALNSTSVNYVASSGQGSKLKPSGQWALLTQSTSAERKLFPKLVWIHHNSVLCRTMTSTNLIWDLLGKAGLSLDKIYQLLLLSFTAAGMEFCVRPVGVKTVSTLMVMLHLVEFGPESTRKWWDETWKFQWERILKVLKSDLFLFICLFLILKSLMLSTNHQSLSCQWGTFVLPLLLLCTNSSLWWVATHTVSRWLHLPRPQVSF